MAVGDGYQLAWKSAIGVYKETTWAGSITTATGAYLEFNSEGFIYKADEKILDAINSQREAFKRIVGNEMAEWKADADLNPGSDALMNMLKQAMGGTVSSVALTGTAYQHTFRIGDMESNADTSTSADMKGLHCQVRKGGGHIWDFLGCRVNTFTIKAEAGAPVTISFEGTAKTATMGATTLSTTVSYTSVLPCVFHGVGIKAATQTGSIDITTAATGTAETYQSFELTVSNNLQTDLRQLGTRQLSHLPQGGLNVSLKMTQRFDTSTAYDRWKAEQRMAFGILLDTNYSVTTSGGSTYSMFIAIPAAYLNYETPVVPGRNGILSHDLNYTCLRVNTTTSYAVQIWVNNETAAYS